ncbi:MAG: hypothetical protein R3F20_06670 [Planctomycetota bacterium]
MSRLTPRGRTDFGRSFQRLGAMGLREGLVVVVSDFFDPAGLAAVEDALKRLRHRLLLVPLTRASDAAPSLEGDLELVDCESGATAEVSVTPELLTRYREAFERFRFGLADCARRRGWGLLAIDVEREIVPQLSSIFGDGSYRA